MKIEKLRLHESHKADELVVVIDVIRAFTTAACALAQGAEKIYLVGTVEEAFRAHVAHPGSLIMGESEGAPVEGFHLSNSPSELVKVDLAGKTLIQRTTAGTQGVIRAKNAAILLASSFVVAESTLRYIRKLEPKKISFIITGQENGDEDLALADYLEARLKQDEVSAHTYLERVAESPSGQVFLSGEVNYLPKADLDIVLDLNRYDFVLRVFHENGYATLKKVQPL